MYPQFNEKATGYIKRYSEFSNRVFDNECLILTNPVQVSEMINVIVNTELKVARRKGIANDLKSFRKTEEGKKAMFAAKTFLEQVLKFATIKSGIFNETELKRISAQCDRADFNDLFFSQYCLKESCILVTHDYDFQELPNQDLQIISANSNYFN